LKKSKLHRAIASNHASDSQIINGVEAEHLLQAVNVIPRANFHFEFPTLESVESLMQNDIFQET
jgi:fatty acid synthase subunit beta